MAGSVRHNNPRDAGKRGVMPSNSLGFISGESKDFRLKVGHEKSKGYPDGWNNDGEVQLKVQVGLYTPAKFTGSDGNFEMDYAKWDATDEYVIPLPASYITNLVEQLLAARKAAYGF